MDLSSIKKEAEEIHKDEVTYRGEPFIMHPMAVMEKMDTPRRKIKAVLHDVLEKGPITDGDLSNEGFDEDIVNSLDNVTRGVEETYEQF